MMTNALKRGLREWWYSVTLGAAYLAVFHVWMALNPPFILLSAMAVLLPLGWLFAVAWKQRYFLNRWDAVIHASVLLDILLEGALIPTHDNYGFYWCALGFAAVLVAYRRHCMRRVAMQKA
ncbi:MAG: hypothetical protein AB1705_11710 [Verrucomicrobiota bacterium]